MKEVSWSSGKLTEDIDGSPPISWGFPFQGSCDDCESQVTKLVQKTISLSIIYITSIFSSFFRVVDTINIPPLFPQMAPKIWRTQILFRDEGAALLVFDNIHQDSGLHSMGPWLAVNMGNLFIRSISINHTWCVRCCPKDQG